jgi:transposase
MTLEASVPMETRRQSAAELINRLSHELAQQKTRAAYAEARLERQTANTKRLTEANERLAAENTALKQQLAALSGGQGEETEASLRAQVAALELQVAELKAQLEQAQRAGRRQAAPFRRRKRKDNPKKPGRKPGHPPANRPVPDHVDEEVDVPLGACPDCGGEVDEQGTDEQYSVEVPEVKPRVTKFVNHYGCCKRCGRRVHSRHPDQTSTATGAAGVQVGPRALAIAIDMKERLAVPYRKVTQVLRLCFGLEVSAGGLSRAAKRITRRCEPTYEALLDYLRKSAVVHGDETGWHIANASKKAWLWVFATPEGVTIYAIRLSRGGDVPSAILGETFEGRLVVDGWVVYRSLGYPLAQCNAHLLRRCAELLEVQQAEAVEFPQQVKQLLQQAIHLGHGRELILDVWGERFWEQAVHDMEEQLTKLLEAVPADPDNRRFRNHLLAHREEVLVFLHDPAVAPTNSLAEREIRPAVVVRKISAGNRTDAGAHVHEVLASLMRTAERGGVRITDLLPDVLRSPGPVVIAPERLGLPDRPDPPSPRVAHAPASDPELRPHSRRVRACDRAPPATATA